MKIWKMKDCFFSDVLKELNSLEKKGAVIREITQSRNENWYTIFYTIEDVVSEEG